MKEELTSWEINNNKEPLFSKQVAILAVYPFV